MGQHRKYDFESAFPIFLYGTKNKRFFIFANYIILHAILMYCSASTIQAPSVALIMLLFIFFFRNVGLKKRPSVDNTQVSNAPVGETSSNASDVDIDPSTSGSRKSTDENKPVS